MPRPYRLSPEGRARRWTPEARAKMSEVWLGKKHSPETRAKMSTSRRAWWANHPEVRAKISASQTGRKHSPEARAKMSAARKTSETRAKMSAARRAWWANPECNPLAGLTQEQRSVYGTLRRKGLVREAALEEARRPLSPRSAAPGTVAVL